MNTTTNTNSDEVKINIASNFALKDFTGSKGIVIHLENHVYDSVIPSLAHLLEIRIPYNEEKEGLVKDIIKYVVRLG
jgi:hypothetical protein